MSILDLSFDTGDVPLDRIHDALAFSFAYPETVPSGELDEETGKPVIDENTGRPAHVPNPETKADHNRRKIQELLISRVYEAEQMIAREKAEKKIKPIEFKN